MTGDEAHHAVAVRRLRVGEQVVLTDGAGHLGVGAVAPDRQAGVLGDRRRPSSRRPSRRPRSSSSRRCPRATAASSRSRCSPRSASPGSCRGPPPARSRSGRASGPRSRWPAGAPRPARPPSRRAGPGCPRSRRWPRPSEVVALVVATPTWRSSCTRPPPRRSPTVDVPAAGRVVVVVGPEGGLTDDEVAAFAEAGAVAVRLGAEVLRTSTAGVAAVAALLSRTPRWRGSAGQQGLDAGDLLVELGLLGPGQGRRVWTTLTRPSSASTARRASRRRRARRRWRRSRPSRRCGTRAR